jgi:hypothetical protein
MDTNVALRCVQQCGVKLQEGMFQGLLSSCGTDRAQNCSVAKRWIRLLCVVMMMSMQNDSATIGSGGSDTVREQQPARSLSPLREVERMGHTQGSEPVS